MNIEEIINNLGAKPIIFSSDMINAIRNNVKTETRRIIRPQPNLPDKNLIYNIDDKEILFGYIDAETNHPIEIKIKYIPKQYLWVRETFRITDFLHPSDDNYGCRELSGIRRRSNGASDDGGFSKAGRTFRYGDYSREDCKSGLLQ